MMKSYSEPLKNKARIEVISNAIIQLTTKRFQSTLARRSYVREVREYFVSKGDRYDKCEAAKLTNRVIEKWESFYDSIILEKSPSNLKVAYLAGPNPENDLDVLCQYGVLPENIWAFESDNSTYLQAVDSALSSRYPFIKIVNSGIDAFLEVSHQKFDIIYLDFCGPLPSRNPKQKTLATITKILAHHSLNSPGALITNFSLPSKDQDSEGYSLIAKLVALYLYPKAFIESNDPENNFEDGPDGMRIDRWVSKIEADLPNYYSQFITRVMMDHAIILSPYGRFPKESTILKKLFDTNKAAKLKSTIDELIHSCGEVVSDTDMHPLLWMFASLSKKINNCDQEYPQIINTDSKFSDFADMFLNQLDTKYNGNEFIDRIASFSVFLSEMQSKEFLSPALLKLKGDHNYKNYHQFCDMFLFHQMLELIFRQIATPYQYNTENLMRWKYKAKETDMFMDLMILDECRYLYDWMPTVDMIGKGVSNIERQLSFRFALDAIRKHSRYYNPDIFFGTGIVSEYTKPFEAKTLSIRKILT